MVRSYRIYTDEYVFCTEKTVERIHFRKENDVSENANVIYCLFSKNRMVSVPKDVSDAGA